MNKVANVRLYQWCRANESNCGREYPKVMKMSHYEYGAIRSNLRKTYPFVGYKIVKNEGEKKHLKFYIKCNT
jgi:hypothetical protein